MAFQLTLIEPESDWQLPDLATLPDFKNAKLIALDTETKDPFLKDLGPSVRRGGYTVGTSIAIDGGPKFYLPYRHGNGENLPHENCSRYLKHQFKHFDGDITGANLGYDLDYLLEEGIEFHPDAMFRDTQVAEPLLDEHKFVYGLDSLAKQYLGKQKDETLLVEAAAAYGIKKKDVKANLWQLPPKYVGPYAEEDAALPLQIIKIQELEIERQGIRDIYDLECQLLPVLIRMRRRGVKIDLVHLQNVENECFKKVKEASDFISNFTTTQVGVHDFMKRDLLARAFEFEGITIPTSLNKEWLEEMASTSQVANAVFNGRKFGKIENDFCQQIKNHLVGDRIHPTFNALKRDNEVGSGTKGTVSGRVSGTDPNIQQQPGRDPVLGPYWRKNFIPETGGLWAALDYSQQEPKMLTHYAEVCKFPGAFEAAEKYRNDPSTDNHQMMADMAHIKRKEAKELFLGLCYGMGQAKLCHKLGLPTEIITLRDGRRMEVAGTEGKKLLRTFATKIPFVSKMADLAESQAKTHGYITTLLGRRIRFPEASDGLNYEWTNKALNRLIQGSSADQTKKALLMIDQAGYKPQLQVHDEIDLTVESEKQALDISNIMLNCVELNIPSKVDVEIGQSWGHSMEKAA